MNTDPVIGRLEQAQDAEIDIALLRRAINCESITGNEAGFAQPLMKEMTGIGLESDLAEFPPGRSSVRGRLGGAGSGQTLLYAGQDRRWDVEARIVRCQGRDMRFTGVNFVSMIAGVD